MVKKYGIKFYFGDDLGWLFLMENADVRKEYPSEIAAQKAAMELKGDYEKALFDIVELTDGDS